MMKVKKNNNIFLGLCGTVYIGNYKYPCIITKVIDNHHIKFEYIDKKDYNKIQTNKNGQQYIDSFIHYVQINNLKDDLEFKGHIAILDTSVIRPYKWIIKDQSSDENGYIIFGKTFINI